MFKRVQEAVADVKETLRRAFHGVSVHQGAVGLGTPAVGETALVAPPPARAWTEFAAAAGEEPWALETRLQTGDLRLEAQLRTEDGWARWEAESRAIGAPLFQGGRTAHLEVPALPRQPKAGKIPLERFRIGVRQHRDPLRTPGTRRAEARCAAPATHRSLAHALRRPLAVEGRALASLPRPLQMRFTLQLVKGTGENIRDLDVLGLFPVPKKGVRQMRIDPRTGRLLVSLSEEAVGAPQGMMVMARRKVDQAVLSCFVEP